MVAVSGGSDSVALLNLLSEFYPENKYIVVYVDHGLRPTEVPAEKELVKNLAASCAADFLSLAVDVRAEQKEKKCSPEEAARTLRYRILETVRKEHNGHYIAVGHTSDDQAEEILLRLIRGSGLAGLGGMAVQNGYIIRPLLQESKENLREYLRNRGICYCEDSSNSDRRFLRNRIRHDLLPYLEQHYNSSMRNTLLRTATILDEENRLLDKLTEVVYQNSCRRDGEELILNLAAIQKEPVAIQRRIFEKMCWQFASRPSFQQIAALLHLLQGKRNAEIHLPQGLRAIKQEESILFCRPVQENGYRGTAVIDKSFTPRTILCPGTYDIPTLGHTLIIQEIHYDDKLLKQPGNLLLDGNSFSFPLTLRHHREGERFHPLGSSGSKKISRFLTDQKIAGNKKKNYPVLASEENILAIPGLRIDNRHRIPPDSLSCIQIQWLQTE